MAIVAEGCDYSFSRPTPAELKAAGKRFACRYFGTAWSGKNATKAECDALRAAGVDVVANFEAGTAGWMKDGYDRGVAAAKIADTDAAACGMPQGRPIYFSQDEDWRGLTLAQRQAVFDCCDGAASVIGRDRVGGYGGYYFLDAAFAAGKITWGWQTSAWSGGLWHPRAQLQQYRNGVALGSGEVDYDRAMVADYGQWGAGGAIPEVDDVSQADVLAALKSDEGKKLISDLVYNATARMLRIAVGPDDASVPAGTYFGRVETKVDSVLAGVEAGVPFNFDLGAATPEQVDALASAIAAHLIVKGQELQGSATTTISLTPKAPA